MIKIKKDENQTFRQWVLQNAFAIFAIIITIANLWLATKLAPLAQGVEINKNSIMAVEKKVEEVKNNNNQQRQEIMGELKYIRNRVDTFYSHCK